MNRKLSDQGLLVWLYFQPQLGLPWLKFPFLFKIETWPRFTASGGMDTLSHKRGASGLPLGLGHRDYFFYQSKPKIGKVKVLIVYRPLVG